MEKIYIKPGQSAVFTTTKGEELEISLEMITPEIAEELLKKNSDNREVRKSKVNKYAKAMENGEWQVNGETCSIYDDGSIASAQHRLLACTIAGKPFETFVVRGINREYANTIDQGAPRKPKDYLHYKKVDNPGTIAAAVTKVLGLRAGRKDTIGKQQGGKLLQISPTDIYTEYMANKEIYDESAKFSIELHKRERPFKNITESDVSGIVAHLRIDKGYEKEFVENFFNQMYLVGNNDGIKVSSPVYALVEKLNVSRNTTNLQLKLSQQKKHIIFCMAWRAYALGNELKEFDIRRKVHDIQLI